MFNSLRLNRCSFVTVIEGYQILNICIVSSIHASHIECILNTPKYKIEYETESIRNITHS